MSLQRSAVPPRLVYLLARVPGNRMIQLCFEWEAPWPTKYAIECHDGPYIASRADRLTWPNAFEFLRQNYFAAQSDLSAWYERVHLALSKEGGAN